VNESRELRRGPGGSDVLRLPGVHRPSGSVRVDSPSFLGLATSGCRLWTPAPPSAHGGNSRSRRPGGSGSRRSLAWASFETGLSASLCCLRRQPGDQRLPHPAMSRGWIDLRGVDSTRSRPSRASHVGASRRHSVFDGSRVCGGGFEPPPRDLCSFTTSALLPQPRRPAPGACSTDESSSSRECVATPATSVPSLGLFPLRGAPSGPVPTPPRWPVRRSDGLPLLPSRRRSPRRPLRDRIAPIRSERGPDAVCSIRGLPFVAEGGLPEGFSRQRAGCHDFEGRGRIP
jgi:hypothetical protein